MIDNEYSVLDCSDTGLQGKILGFIENDTSTRNVMKQAFGYDLNSAINNKFIDFVWLLMELFNGTLNGCICKNHGANVASHPILHYRSIEKVIFSKNSFLYEKMERAERGSSITLERLDVSDKFGDMFRFGSLGECCKNALEGTRCAYSSGNANHNCFHRIITEEYNQKGKSVLIWKDTDPITLAYTGNVLIKCVDDEKLFRANYGLQIF